MWDYFDATKKTPRSLPLPVFGFVIYRDDRLLLALGNPVALLLLAIALPLGLALDRVPFHLAGVFGDKLVAVPLAGDGERNRVVLERGVTDRRFLVVAADQRAGQLVPVELQL